MKDISKILVFIGLFVIMTVKSAPVDTDNGSDKQKDITESDMIISINAKLENNSLIRDRRGTGHHYTEEILAQAMCQAHATHRGQRGRVYAVGRNCQSYYTDTCTIICGSRYLRIQDSQTRYHSWSCIQAYHIYENRRETTTDGNRYTAKLGLKSKMFGCGDLRCGPNYCCCYAV